MSLINLECPFCQNAWNGICRACETKQSDEYVKLRAEYDKLKEEMELLQDRVVIEAGWYLYSLDHDGCDECGEHNGCGLGRLYDSMPADRRQMFEAKMKGIKL